MKILIIKTVPDEIKIDKITYNIQEIGLARALRRQGHECDIMCYSANSQMQVKTVDADNGQLIKIYCMRATVFLKNCFFHDAEKIISQYDSIQIAEYNQIFAWYCARKYRDKMVIYHGPYYCDFNKRYNMMAKVFDIFLLPRYKRLNTKIITKSKLAKKYLEDKGLKNVHCVGVGIDCEALLNGNADVVPFVEEELKKFPFTNKLLYIGRLEKRRNSLFLLEMLQELNSRGIDVGLIVVGKGEREYCDEFFAKAEELGVSDRILYTSEMEQKHLCQVYPLADVFVLPTIYDIFGMVLLEAMYYGKPVLTTVNGGSDMLIENGENGFVFSSFDIKAWCDKAEELLYAREKCEVIGQKAHRKIKDEFTWDVLCKQMSSLYKS